MGKFLEKLKKNREAMAKQREADRKIYREAYTKQKHISLAERAKQEAKEKHRPTRKQKIDNILKGIENIGNIGMGTGTTQRRRSPQKSKRGKQKKKKYAVVGGKAYEIGGQPTRSGTRKTKKKQGSSDPFDLGGIDDIDFDF